MLALDSRSGILKRPANALSETFPAAAGTLIFAQSPNSRNGQIGCVRTRKASYSEGASSGIRQPPAAWFVAFLKEH